MDMKISGSGAVSGGEYDNIKSSGTVRMCGTVKCTSLKSSGTARGEKLVCTGTVRTSGSAKFTGEVRARDLKTSGTFLANDLEASTVTASGKFIINGQIKVTEINAQGSFKACEDIEAENVELCGKVVCCGLLNAENTVIKFSRGTEIGSIGGGKIELTREKLLFIALPFRVAKISSAIEGDEIKLDHVTAPRVTGRSIIIGAGCKIELLEYSESCEIDKRAIVKHTKRVGIDT